MSYGPWDQYELRKFNEPTVYFFARPYRRKYGYFIHTNEPLQNTPEGRMTITEGWPYTRDEAIMIWQNLISEGWSPVKKSVQ